MAERFPLSWPAHWKRTKPELRRSANFRTKLGSDRYGYNSLTITEGLSRLKAQLGHLRAGSVVISSNVVLNSYGDPSGRSGEPKDPGVAIYFELAKHDRVLACDRWLRVADNFAAVAAHIDCIRAVDRYGVGSIEQAFAGYDALPAPGAARPWWQVLGFAADELDRHSTGAREIIEARFRELAKAHHPDAGGDHDRMAEITAARVTALAALS